MSDRREFLKLFGVGCAVIPIVGGMPQLAAEAKLIETPKVEIVESLSMMTGTTRGGFGEFGKCGIMVVLEKPDGKRIMLSAETFFTEVKISTMDIPSDNPHRAYFMRRAVTSHKTFEYEIKGRCTPDQAGNLMEVTELL